MHNCLIDFGTSFNIMFEECRHHLSTRFRHRLFMFIIIYVFNLLQTNVAQSGPYGCHLCSVWPQGPPLTLPKCNRDPISTFLWFGIDLGTMLAPFWFLFLSFFALIGIRSAASTPTTIRSHHENHTPWFAGSLRVRRSRSASTMTRGINLAIHFHTFAESTEVWIPHSGSCERELFRIPRSIIFLSIFNCFLCFFQTVPGDRF